MTAHQIEEPAGIVADLGAQLPQRHELSFALAHGNLLGAPIQTHELHQIRFQALARLTHGDETGAHARHVPVVVRAEHIDQLRKTALALVQVVSDVRGEIGRLAVLAHHDAVLLIAEALGAKPHGTLFTIQLPLALQTRERPLDGAAVLERALRGPVIKHDAKLGKILADAAQHGGEGEF